MRLVITLLILIYSSAANAAAEALCDELDADGNSDTYCLCSEPVASGTEPSGAGDWDPTDSPDTEECGNLASNPNPMPGLSSVSSVKGSPAFHDSSDNYDLIDAASAPIPLAGPTKVLRVTQPEGTLDAMWTLDYEFTDATICFRWYANWNHSEWPTNPHTCGGCGDNDQDIKVIRLESDTGDPANSSPELFGQMIEWGHGVYSERPDPDGTPPLENASPHNMWLYSQWEAASTPAHSWNDWRVDWGRFELCVDHNSRAGGDANKFNFRHRIVRLDGSKTVVYPATLSRFTSSAAWTGKRTKIEFVTADWFDTAYPSPAPHSYYSHFMVAGVAEPDETFWIGPASEIEGGGGVITTIKSPFLLP